jgi:hypothetical protein
MSATNNLTSLGLYIAYSAAMRLASTPTPEQFGWTQAKELGEALQHALTLNPETITPKDMQRLLKVAASGFFFLYLMSSYMHGSTNKRLLLSEMRGIQTQLTLLNQRIQELSPPGKK